MRVPRILLVEDDPDNILIVQRILHKAKLANPLNVVEDGEAAIAYLSGQGIFQDREKFPLPDLILLDLNLPRKSGFDVLAWLGQQPISQHVTVTVLTSSKESNDIIRAYELGAHGYLVKPVDSDYLLDIVDAMTLPLVKPFRALVIDDNPDDRAIIIRILRKEFPDMEFREINSLTEFNQSLDIGDFELVISDYALGWINGLTILRSIKSRYPDCPVIVCTGTSSEEIAAEMIRSGLDDYVIKSAKHTVRLPNAVRMALSRSHNRKALKESEARYRDLFENANDLILTTDLEGNITSFNRMSEQISGYTRQEALSMNIEQLIFPQSLEKVREMVAEKLKEQVNVIYEIEGVAKDGRRIPLEISSSPIYKKDKIVGIQAIGRDITERKKAEEALKKSEAEFAGLYREFKGLLDAIPDYLTFQARDLTIIWANQGAANGLSKEAKDLIGQHCYSLWHDRTEACESCPVLRSFDTGEPDSEEIITSDGRCWDLRTVPLKKESGKTIGVIQLGRDVTQRKESELALKQAEIRYRLLFEEAPVMYVITRNQANVPIIADCNELFCNELGYPKAEILERPITDFYTVESRNKMLEDDSYKRALKGNFLSEERTLVARNGRLIETIVHAVPEVDSTGVVIGTRAMFTDITEMKQKERELAAIARVSRSVRTVTTSSEISQVILNETLAILQTDNGALYLFNPATGEMVIERGKGIWASKTGQIIPVGKGLNALLIANHQPYLTSDVRNDPQLLWPELYSEYHAVAGVPMLAQDQLIGTLWAARQEHILNNDLRLLGSIADIAANAMRRAALTELTEQRLNRLTALRTIDMAINSYLDLKETLNIFLEQVTSQLGVDATAVILLNPHSSFLEYTARRGFRARVFEQSRLRLGEGFAGRIALDRRTILIKNMESQTAYLDKGEVPVAILPSEFSNLSSELSRLKSEGFVGYCGIPLLIKGQIKGILEVYHRSLLEPAGEWMDFLETLASQVALAIDNATLFNDLQRANFEMIVAYDTTLEGWSKALDLRDEETEGHSQRVTDLSIQLARFLKMTEGEIVHLRRGAQLHDIGKMGVPDAILLKPGPLTDEEWVIMRKHPVYAQELLSPISYLRPAIDIPFYHHEKWDGTGYPLGLKGEQIPLAARIFALSDVWDALSSDRPYRPAWPRDKVQAHILAGAGTHFAPKVVEAFMSLETSQPEV